MLRYTYVHWLSTYLVTLYTVQRGKVVFGDDSSLLRSGDAGFQSQTRQLLLD